MSRSDKLRAPAPAKRQAPAGQRPLCLACGRPLRTTRFPQPTHASPFGDYGDGRFCGLRCGYRWSLTYLDRHPAYEKTLAANVRAFMAAQKKETP